jgi:hypothetical protein
MYDVGWARRLQALRDVGDPLADAVVERLNKEQGIEYVHKLLRTLVLEPGISFKPMLPELRQYLIESATLPDWMDNDKVKAGTELFADHSIEIVMMLFTASLPTLYAAKQGAEVLTLTKRMVNYTYLERRIFETAQFVLDVTDTNAFTSKGKAISQTQKVRLMHAIIRFLICNDEKWKPYWHPSWGTPISQVELVGTMMSFSVTVIQALERSGMLLDADEKENYLHLWKVVGSMLGIRDELMPKSYADAANLMATCELLFIESSPTGRILADVLLRFLNTHSGGMMPNLINDMIRHAVGKYTADSLGLPEWSWSRFILRFQKAAWLLESWLDHDIPIISNISRYAEKRIITMLLDKEREHVMDDDSLPENLRPNKLYLPNHMRVKFHMPQVENTRIED